MSALLPGLSSPQTAVATAAGSGIRSVALFAGAIFLAWAGTGLQTPAAAQTPPATPAVKAPTSKAAAAGGSGAAKASTPNKSKVASRKKAAEPPVEPEVVVAEADDQQMLAAKEVLLGESGCEFDQKIQVDASSTHPGYVDMSFNKKKYVMKPVMSSTGALRLEDVRSEALMIQISSKTMLMNQKTGQRLVDNCIHPTQKVTTVEAGQALMK
jgi:hypothetical protein